MADVLAAISIGAVLLVMSLLLTFYGVYHLHYKRYGAFVMTGEKKLKANVLATRFCKIVVKNIRLSTKNLVSKSSWTMNT